MACRRIVFFSFPSHISSHLENWFLGSTCILFLPYVTPPFRCLSVCFLHYLIERNCTTRFLFILEPGILLIVTDESVMIKCSLLEQMWRPFYSELWYLGLWLAECGTVFSVWLCVPHYLVSLVKTLNVKNIRFSLGNNAVGPLCWLHWALAWMVRSHNLSTIWYNLFPQYL